MHLSIIIFCFCVSIPLAASESLLFLNYSLEKFAQPTKMTLFAARDLETFQKELSEYLKRYETTCKHVATVAACQSSLIEFLEDLPRLCDQIVQHSYTVGGNKFLENFGVYREFLHPMQNALELLISAWYIVLEKNNALGCDQLDIIYDTLSRLRDSVTKKASIVPENLRGLYKWFTRFC